MSAPSGTLAVVILKARNLRDKHTFTKQDPFVSVQLGTRKENTPIDRRGGQHPVWDHEVRLSIAPESEARTLIIRCYAKESKENDFIGEGSVDITETLMTREYDEHAKDWVPIYDSNGGSPLYRGEIYLEMTFFTSEPRTGIDNENATRRRPLGPVLMDRMKHETATNKLPKSISTPHPCRQHPQVYEFPDVEIKTDLVSTTSGTPFKQNLPRKKEFRSELSTSHLGLTQQIPAVLRAGPGHSSPRFTHAKVGMPEPDFLQPTLSSTPQSCSTPKSSSQVQVNPNLGSLESDARMFGGSMLFDSLANGAESSGSRASQELADEELASLIARNEGIDIEALKVSEQISQADEELARSLTQ